MLASGRGPALQSYLARIKRDCTKYWENGHRLCESSSLSGSHCIHQVSCYIVFPLSSSFTSLSLAVRLCTNKLIVLFFSYTGYQMNQSQKIMKSCHVANTVLR